MKATFFVPDSVAGEVHERQIDMVRIDGLPLGQQIAIIDAYDRFKIEGADMFETDRFAVFCEEDGVGILEVETDGRGHYYWIVFGPDESIAREKAKTILDEWADGEEED